MQAAELRTQHGEAEEELKKLRAEAQRLAGHNRDLESQTQVPSPTLAAITACFLGRRFEMCVLVADIGRQCADVQKSAAWLARAFLMAVVSLQLHACAGCRRGAPQPAAALCGGVRQVSWPGVAAAPARGQVRIPPLVCDVFAMGAALQTLSVCIAACLNACWVVAESNVRTKAFLSMGCLNGWQASL